MRAIFGLMALAALVSGCASTAKDVETPHYRFKSPQHWKVQSVGGGEGQATIISIESYGAVIDDGAGAADPRGANYDAVTAPVEVRLYAWKDPAPAESPTALAARLLHPAPELTLNEHRRLADDVMECGQTFRRKFRVAGQNETALELVKPTRMRTILVGGRSGGTLLGAVGRVEIDGPDQGRYCHNLRNLQVQLQNVLDVVNAKSGTP